jgi:hypothetical protein
MSWLKGISSAGLMYTGFQTTTLRKAAIYTLTPLALEKTRNSITWSRPY